MKRRLNLVTFEDPIWPTIQGEGILVGTPSVFIRLWGCDDSCSWCDTKKSWMPGSTSQELDIDAIVEKARSFRLSHAVITGGNPVLQPELPDLIVALQAEHYALDMRRVGDQWPGMHVTVETQASIFDEAVSRHANLMSLSPKLHNWRDEVVLQYLCAALWREKDIQVKVVVTSTSETLLALDRFVELFRWTRDNKGKTRDLVHFILQPESSLGRRGVEMVRSTLEQWRLEHKPGYAYPVVRIIPQFHKVGLYVR